MAYRFVGCFVNWSAEKCWNSRSNWSTLQDESDVIFSPGIWASSCVPRDPSVMVQFPQLVARPFKVGWVYQSLVFLKKLMLQFVYIHCWASRATAWGSQNPKSSPSRRMAGWQSSRKVNSWRSNCKCSSINTGWNFAVLPWPAMAPLALRTAFQLSKRGSSRCCLRGWSSLALWLLWGGTVLSAVLCCIFVICQVFGKFSTLCTKFIIIFPLCNSTFKGLSTDLHARQMRIAIVHQGLNHVRWPKPGSSTGLTILCLHIFQMLHVWNTYLGTCGWFWG